MAGLLVAGLVGQGTAKAAMTILTGPPVGTHVGNLVTNGSFEIGAPSPAQLRIRHEKADSRDDSLFNARGVREARDTFNP